LAHAISTLYAMHYSGAQGCLVTPFLPTFYGAFIAVAILLLFPGES
jgi:hypothetical protein